MQVVEVNVDLMACDPTLDTTILRRMQGSTVSVGEIRSPTAVAMDPNALCYQSRVELG
jgi:hypothetical protein